MATLKDELQKTEENYREFLQHIGLLAMLYILPDAVIGQNDAQLMNCLRVLDILKADLQINQALLHCADDMMVGDQLLAMREECSRVNATLQQLYGWQIVRKSDA
ncbi:MAG: hypothetical protein HQM04_11585 [Magnetococcales bacterium]|nr:hypothetical protein [Magnetococcales bacterium]MBF0115666.1 hypothetical protein [Magnetococcales bacterium]